MATVVLWGISPVTIGAALRLIHLVHINKLYLANIIFIHEHEKELDNFICRYSYMDQFLSRLNEDVIHSERSWTYLLGYIPQTTFIHDKVVYIKPGNISLSNGKIIGYDYILTGKYLPVIWETVGQPRKELQFIRGSKKINGLEISKDPSYELHADHMVLYDNYIETIYNFSKEIPQGTLYIWPTQSSISKSMIHTLEDKYKILSRGRLGGWCQTLPDDDFMHGVESADFVLSGQGETLYFNNIPNHSEIRNIILDEWIEFDTQFVIANYNEVIDWVKYLPGDIIVYHKGYDYEPDNFRGLWKNLPNIGMEAHTYLTHIVENYHSLKDVTVFLLGKLHKYQNSGWIFDDLTEYRRAIQKGLIVRKIIDFADWQETQFTPEERVEYRGGIISKSTHGKTIKEYWEYIFNSAPPTIIPSTRVAAFSLRKDLIHKHPLQFYQSLLDTVSEAIKPEETYFLRTIWLSLFSD